MVRRSRAFRKAIQAHMDSELRDGLRQTRETSNSKICAILASQLSTSHFCVLSIRKNTSIALKYITFFSNCIEVKTVGRAPWARSRCSAWVGHDREESFGDGNRVEPLRSKYWPILALSGQYFNRILPNSDIFGHHSSCNSSSRNTQQH